MRDEESHLPESQLQKARHLIAGLEWELTDLIALNVEAYYKDYPLLVNYNRNKLFNPIGFPDQPEILKRDFVLECGYAKGIEAEVIFRKGSVNAGIAYSLAVTERSYEGLDGRSTWYYPHYDRRHNLNLAFSCACGLDRSWSVALRWNYGSGFPFTQSIGTYEFNGLDETRPGKYLSQNGQLRVHYGDLNLGRLPVYDRLDISLKKTIRFSKQSELEIEASAVNVYDQQNIYYVDRSTHEIVNQLPFLPGLGITFTF